jgi:hypothetical protein
MSLRKRATLKSKGEDGGNEGLGEKELPSREDVKVPAGK